MRRFSLSFSLLTLTLLTAAANITVDRGLDSIDLTLAGGPLGWDGGDWSVVVDGVMGGKSSGDMTFEDDGTTMVFSGTISLDGGGFSSVRMRALPSAPLDLSRYAGVVLEVEARPLGWSADDATAPLGMHLQFEDSTSSYDYSSAFAVPIGGDGVGTESTEIFLPMGSFDRASRFGFQCNACALDKTSISSMSLYVLFQKGAFEVRVRSVVAVREAASFSAPSVAFRSTDQLVALLRQTVAAGSAVYDKSYSEMCIAMYWSALSALVAASAGVSAAARGVACAGLSASAGRAGKADRAWALRNTLDAVVADASGIARGTRESWLPEAVAAGGGAYECEGWTSVDAPAVLAGSAVPPEDVQVVLESELMSETSGTLVLGSVVDWMLPVGAMLVIWAF